MKIYGYVCMYVCSESEVQSEPETPIDNGTHSLPIEETLGYWACKNKWIKCAA